MTNLETISYYEKLHDLFERVHPSEMPKKLEKLIDYLEKAGDHHAVDVSDVTSILYDMKDAFTFALEKKGRALMLTHESKQYEVNIYPIMHFVKDNQSIDGELDQLKSRLIGLAHAKNIAEMKLLYQFVDDLSVTFEVSDID